MIYDKTDKWDDKFKGTVEASSTTIARLRAELAAAEAKLEKAREALTEAKEMVESWGGYANDYFKDKHGFANDLTSLEDAINDIA